MTPTQAAAKAQISAVVLSFSRGAEKSMFVMLKINIKIEIASKM